MEVREDRLAQVKGSLGGRQTAWKITIGQGKHRRPPHPGRRGRGQSEEGEDGGERGRRTGRGAMGGMGQREREVRVEREREERPFCHTESPTKHNLQAALLEL